MAQTSILVAGPYGALTPPAVAGTANSIFGATNNFWMNYALNGSRLPINRGGGTYQNLVCIVTANSHTSGGNSVKSVVANAIGTQIAAWTTAIGTFADTTHADTLVDGSDFGYQGISGQAASMTMTGVSAQIITSAQCYSVVYGIASAASNANLKIETSGTIQNQTNEPNAQQVSVESATLDRMQALLSATTVGGTMTFVSRINGANGTQTLTPTNTTAVFEDTTHADSIVNGTLYNAQSTDTGTTKGTIFFTGFRYTSGTAGVSPIPTGGNSFGSSGNPAFWDGAGNLGAATLTEANTQQPLAKACTLSKLALFINTNASSNVSPFLIRINGATGNQLVTPTASTTGAYYDTTHSDSMTQNQYMNYMTNTWLAPTSNAFNHVVILATTATSVTLNQSAAITQNQTVRTRSANSLTESVSQGEVVQQSLRNALKRGVTQAQVVSVGEAVARSIRVPVSVTITEFVSVITTKFLNLRQNIHQAQQITASRLNSRSIGVNSPLLTRVRQTLSTTISVIQDDIISIKQSPGRLISVTQAQVINRLAAITRRIRVTSAEIVRSAILFGRSYSITQGQTVGYRMLKVNLFPVGLMQGQVVNYRQSFGLYKIITQAQVVQRTLGIVRRVRVSQGQVVHRNTSFGRQVSIRQAEAASVTSHKADLLRLGVTQAQVVGVRARRTLNKLISVTQAQAALLRTNIKSVVVRLTQAQAVRVTLRYGVVARTALSQLINVLVKSAFRRSITEWVNAADLESTSMQAKAAVLEGVGAQAFGDLPFSAFSFIQENVTVADIISAKLFECPPINPYPQPPTDGNWWNAVHSPADPGGPTPGLPDWIATQPWWQKNHSTKS